MLPISTFQKIISITPFIIAAAFMAVSVWIIRRNQPFLFRSILLPWLMALAILPVIGVFLYIVLTDEPAAICSVMYVPIIVIASIAFGFWRLSAEYTVIAASEGSLRAAVVAALQQLGVPFEETLLGFYLPNLYDTLQVKFSPLMDTAQIRMKSRGNIESLSKIIQAVREHLAGEASITIALIYGGLGILCLILAIYQYNRG